MKRVFFVLALLLLPLAGGVVYIIEDDSGGVSVSSEPYVLLALEHHNLSLEYNLSVGSGAYEVNLT